MEGAVYVVHDWLYNQISGIPDRSVLKFVLGLFTKAMQYTLLMCQVPKPIATNQI